MDENISKNSKLEIFIAKMYVFFLPFLMIGVIRTNNKFGGAIKYFDVFFNILGLFFILIKLKNKNKVNTKNKLLLFFLFWILITSLTSIFMAVYVDFKYGLYAGESSYSAVFHTILIFIQYFFMILYNIEIYKIIGLEAINKVISKSLIVVLIIGYIQLLITLNFNSLLNLYNKIDVLDILPDEVVTLKMPLTESEGALAGNLLAIFILPFLMSNIIIKKNLKSNLIQVILWIPIIIMSRSLAEYILCIACILQFSVYYMKVNNKRNIFIFPVLFVIIITISFVFYNNIIPEEYKNAIDYTILDKFNDSDNGSTVLRTKIPLKYNLYSFKKSPLIGIGNGNQGYFYYESFDYQYINVPGVKSSYINADTTIYNGMLFFPSILSGYGIVGTLLLLILIIKMNKNVERNKDSLKEMYYMYKIARIPILIAGFQTLFVGCYYLWFTLSIPFIKCTKGKINN